MEKMTGRVVLKTPFMCLCCVKIDGVHKRLNPFKGNQTIKLPYGKHSINVGISYDEMPEMSSVRCETVSHVKEHYVYTVSKMKAR